MLEHPSLTSRSEERQYSAQITLSGKTVKIFAKNIELYFDIPFKVGLNFELIHSGFSFTSNLNFKDAMLSYGKQYYNCVLTSQNSSCEPTFDWHQVTGYFKVSFATTYNGKTYSFFGELRMNTEINMGKLMGIMPGYYNTIAIGISFTL